MSELDAIVQSTATRLFADHVTPELLISAEAGQWPAALWAAAEELGFPLAMVAEEAGGVGLGVLDAMALIRLAGFHAVPLPVAETMLAAHLLADAGLPVPPGPLAFGPTGAQDRVELQAAGNGWRLTGTLQRVPWGRHAAAVAIAVQRGGDWFTVSLPAAALTVVTGDNLAREPRDTLSFDTIIGADQMGRSRYPTPHLHALGAAVRAVAMAGAMERVLEITVAYANERVQFGRPIGKFQAVQQSIAALAGLVAAAGRAGDIAAEAVRDGAATTPVAAAKIRTGEAAGQAAAITHQVHGAIGFTREYLLHAFTKRLWSWREEFGNETEWSLRLGRQVADAGAAGFWAFVTDTGPTDTASTDAGARES